LCCRQPFVLVVQIRIVHGEMTAKVHWHRLALGRTRARNAAVVAGNVVAIGIATEDVLVDKPGRDVVDAYVGSFVPP